MRRLLSLLNAHDERSHYRRGIGGRVARRASPAASHNATKLVTTDATLIASGGAREAVSVGAPRRFTPVDRR